MAAPESSSGPEASGGGLASRVGLVFLLFAVLAAPAAKVGTPTSPAYEALEEDATQAGPLDFAILGNSRPHVGLSPKLVAAGLAQAGLGERRGWNFAVDGTDAMHHASFGLHGLLAEKTPPRVIVWAVDPLMFDASRKANRLEQLKSGDVALLARSGAPLEVVLDVATMQAFPPYRHRPLVLAKIEDKTEGIGKRLAKVQRAIGLEEVVHPKAREYAEHPDEGFDPFVVLADWEFRFYQRHGPHYATEYKALTFSEWHESFARKFLERARDAGVLVVMLEMPLSPYYREHFASGEKHRVWRDHMQRLAADEGALFWSDAAHYASDKDFGDPGHMPLSTAEDYSRFLGDKLGHDPRVVQAFAKPGEGKGR